MAVNTPAQASEYYLPFFLSGKMDLTFIRKELKEVHKFSEEDIRITARVLSNAHVKHAEQKSLMSSGYFGLVIGIAVLVGGILLTFYLWDKGFVSTLSLIIVAAGLGILYRSNKSIGSKR